MKKLVLLPCFVVALLAVVIAPAAKAALVSGKTTLSFSAESPGSAAVAWQGVDLDGGATVVDPRFDAPGWLVKLKHAYAATNGGGIVKISDKLFEEVLEAPADGYVPDRKYKPFGPAPEDTYSSALGDWFGYDFMSHLAYPESSTFILKTADGHYAKLQLVDVVSKGKALCLEKGRMMTRRVKKEVRANDDRVHVSFRYVYNTVAGDRRLGDAPSKNAPKSAPRAQLNDSCSTL